jgi:alkylation response protein AidB-like acyl-CoA dehydrogenase
MLALDQRVRDHFRAGHWRVPLPGAGDTVRRHRRLAAFGCEDLSLARIAEGHADAVAILHEAGHTPRADCLYAVWAADGAQSRVRAERSRDGWCLHGLKQFCSGASFVDAALLTAHTACGLLLFDLAMDSAGIHVEDSRWKNAALADTATTPVSFTAVAAADDCVIGAANWYLTRPGFWHGAIGPAACWAGGALSLIAAAGRFDRPDPHSRAHQGALAAAEWALTAILDQAGREIDADPGDGQNQARVRALKVRHLIERLCTEVLDRFGRATGPHLLVGDAQVARQFAALSVYLRQCHGERDLATIPLQPTEAVGPSLQGA